MNDSLSSSLNKSDGILRADEIAQLNLNGCSLVVLSACQTGLGTSNSEGVYGLQRAFKLAGAQSILMSLWNVEDKATTELMVQMYSNLMKGLNANKALYAAQKYMRTKGYSPDKWAAFILLN
jgi:CHAT domain-containing protein